MTAFLAVAYVVQAAAFVTIGVLLYRHVRQVERRLAALEADNVTPIVGRRRAN